MQLTNRTIRTTIRYAWLDLLDWFDRQKTNAIGMVAIVAILLLIVGAIGRIRSEPAAVVAIPTPAIAQPIIIIATPQTMAYPTAVPQAQQAAYAPAVPRMVVAFAAPNGDILGPIEAPELGALVARYGDQWVATMHDGAMVWIRVSEMGGSLANVQPQAPQPGPRYVEQPDYVPQPQSQTDNQPALPPEQPAEQQPPAAPAVVAAPAQQAQQAQQAQPAATPSLQEAVDRTAASTAANPDGGTGWKLEHCFGSGADEVCQ